jgi:hypothetical protein
LTEIEGADNDFAQLIVRQHPKLDQAKALDVLVSELDQFKSVGDLVVVEVRMPDSTVREIYMKLSDFGKAAPNGNMDEILSRARGTKGRVPGSRNGIHSVS